MRVLVVEVVEESAKWKRGLSRAWSTPRQQPFLDKPLLGTLCKEEVVPYARPAQSCQQFLPHPAQSAFGIDLLRPGTQQVSVLA